MYYIIETEEQLAKLTVPDKCFIELVTKSDECHPALSTPSVIYYNNFEKGYILVLNHSEGFSISIASVQNFLQRHSTVYLLNKKKHSYYLDLPNSADLLFTALEVDGVVKDFTCDTVVHKDFGYKHRYLPNINCLIPICKHYERCECMFETIRPYIEKNTNLPWLNDYTEVYRWVEEQGIAVNEKLFDKHYEPTWKANSVKGGKIYTQYNLYNITARPTNAFNTINFLALSKDGARASFVPSNDFFADFDFDGYHLRLIANMLNIELPTEESIHTYLGKLYYGEGELTEDQYQESKKITFRQLYNGVEDAVKEIELFKQVSIFITDLWKQYSEQGYIQLPNGRKLVQENANPQKLFNYYIQCLETVNNVKKLKKLKEYLSDKQSKVVLVVYDSILVDFSKQDGMSTYYGIKSILEEDNYMVKVKVGSDYDMR
jgi:hypothetical protein